MNTYALECPELCAPVADESRTILIVDDDEAMVDVLRHRLSSQGYQILTAPNGDEGCRRAITERPDLILLDLRLPDTDGFTVCQRLVDSQQTSLIPVIILSAMERPDIIRRSRAAGCQYFVRKPYDPNALLLLIQHAINEARDWKEA